MALVDALVTLAQQYTVTLDPEAESPNPWTFQVNVVEPPASALQVSDLVRRLEIVNAPIDLSFLVKNVRFTTAAVTDAAEARTTLGGMPIASVGSFSSLTDTTFTSVLESLTEGGLNPPGVPGLLGTLSGTVPLVLERLDEISLIPTAEVRLRVTDASGVAVDDVQWKIGSGDTARTVLGGTLSRPVAELTRLVFIPGLPFTELTAGPPPLVSRRVQVSIRVTAGTASSGWVDVPPDPIEIRIPAIQVPTVAVFCTTTGFGGRKLILVPKESPLANLEALRGALARLSSTLGRIGSVVGAVSFLTTVTTGIAAGGAITLALVPATDQLDHEGSQYFLQTSGLPNLDDIKLVERGWPARDFPAEDRFDSMILLGPPGRRIDCYNAKHYSPHEGHMAVSVGRELVALVASLQTATPASIPEGRVSVVVTPTDHRDVDHTISTFANELSSVQFT